MWIYQIGTIAPPDPVKNIGTVEGGGITNFINIILQILIIGGGIYAILNFIFAGYSFISAGGDAKKIEAAWAKIWQTMLGLLVIAGSLLLAAVLGRLIFGSYDAILSPKIPTV